MWSRFRNFSFFAIGTGVAVDLAATKVLPSVSTAGNLTAVAGGSAYSIFKNLKTAIGIIDNTNCSREILKNLYTLTGIENEDIEAVLQSLQIIQERINSLKIRIDVTLDPINSIKRAYLYSGINVASQLLFTISTIVIHTCMIKDKDNNIWDALSISNLILIPLFILMQYGIHSFSASKLREINETTTTLKQELKRLEDSYYVRILNLRKLVHDIEENQNSLAEIHTNMRNSEAEMVTLTKELDDLSKEIADPDFDEADNMERYNTIAEQQSRISLRLNETQKTFKDNQETKHKIEEKLHELRAKVIPLYEELRWDSQCLQQTQELFASLNHQITRLSENSENESQSLSDTDMFNSI